MNTKELAENLDKWFTETSNSKNRWNNNPVGLLLNKRLNETGNWKNAPRGDLRKAKRAKEMNLAKNWARQNGEDFDEKAWRENN